MLKRFGVTGPDGEEFLKRACLGLYLRKKGFKKTGDWLARKSDVWQHFV